MSLSNKPIEETFWGRVNSDQQASLTLIRNAVKTIWSGNRILWGYTDHGLGHSIRVLENAERIIGTYKGDCPLTDDETYLLTAACYLHDIGMQWDYHKHPAIADIANRNYGANIRAEVFANGTPYKSSHPESTMIRENHSRITAAYLEYARSEVNSLFHEAVLSINDALLGDLIDICLYHSSKLEIQKCDVFGSRKRDIKKKMIAAILRLADEIDTGSKRVNNKAVLKDIKYDIESEMYWYLCSLTTIQFNMAGNVYVQVSLHPNQDETSMANFLERKIIDDFKKKNKYLFSCLQELSFGIDFSGIDSAVSIDKFSDMLDPKFIEYIRKQ